MSSTTTNTARLTTVEGDLVEVRSELREVRSDVSDIKGTQAQILAILRGSVDIAENGEVSEAKPAKAKKAKPAKAEPTTEVSVEAEATPAKRTRRVLTEAERAERAQIKADAEARASINVPLAKFLTANDLPRNGEVWAAAKAGELSIVALHKLAGTTPPVTARPVTEFLTKAEVKFVTSGKADPRPAIAAREAAKTAKPAKAVSAEVAEAAPAKAKPAKAKKAKATTEDPRVAELLAKGLTREQIAAAFAALAN